VKTIRISVEVWRAVNRERRSPAETFDGAIRRRLKIAGVEPEIPDEIMIHISDAVHALLSALWEPDVTLDGTLGALFGVDWPES
jgi:hypothetical protein